MSFLDKIFGDSSSHFLAEAKPLLAKINSLEQEMKNMPDSQFPSYAERLRERLSLGEIENDILPEAFALVREAAVRTLGQRHFDVQILGGIALHRGNIAEMKTGEGKTLVATLPAFLNALSKKGVHVITVNDYLARRDAVWMGEIFYFLGLSVGVLNHESSYLYDEQATTRDVERDELGSFLVVHEYLRPCKRREAYEADILYGTNHEFGFDYLRDNIAYSNNDLAQRASVPHNYAIVDEIDSILIDEARTPLIISAPVSEPESFYKTFASLAGTMDSGKDFEVDEKMRAITLTEAGIEKAEKSLGVENIYTEKGVKFVHHLETAVRAKALFHLDKDYVVKDNEVVIVDQNTGRLQPGRRWSEGLHQAIEAKEDVRIKEESRTFASVSFQNYFRLYNKLSGMTGTAKTSSEEFIKVYGLETIVVPTNRPSARDDKNDLIFQTEAGKFKAVAKRVKELNDRGQPVLVGTVSIDKNEVLSAYLSREGIKHEILNAKNHEREGEIIAQAGKKGSVVIATNMAGRGVDIKLGGVPCSPEESEEVKSLEGLFVLGTERHEARRIDNQLRGRSGRQGDPGVTQFFVSLEDSLMKIFASDVVKNMMGKFGIPEDEPIENRLVTKAIESAQTKIEGFHFDARKHLLEYDDVMNRQRKSIYEKRRRILLGSLEEVENFLEEVVLGAESDIIDFVVRKKEELGAEKFLESFRILSLQVIDMFWVEHLEAMDYMQSSVRLRAYGQRDPLVEYKREGLRLFKELEEGVNAQIARMILSIGGGALKEEKKNLEEVHRQASLVSAPSGNLSDKRVATKPKEEIGRNDPCSCGSGKKYKKCCGV